MHAARTQLTQVDGSCQDLQGPPHALLVATTRLQTVEQRQKFLRCLWRCDGAAASPPRLHTPHILQSGAVRQAQVQKSSAEVQVGRQVALRRGIRTARSQGVCCIAARRMQHGQEGTEGEDATLVWRAPCCVSSDVPCCSDSHTLWQDSGVSSSPSRGCSGSRHMPEHQVKRPRQQVCSTQHPAEGEVQVGWGVAGVTVCLHAGCVAQQCRNEAGRSAWVPLWEQQLVEGDGDLGHLVSLLRCVLRLVRRRRGDAVGPPTPRTAQPRPRPRSQLGEGGGRAVSGKEEAPWPHLHARCGGVTLRAAFQCVCQCRRADAGQQRAQACAFLAVQWAEFGHPGSEDTLSRCCACGAIVHCQATLVVHCPVSLRCNSRSPALAALLKHGSG